MTRDFQIHRHPERGLLAIKSGFSWPAFLFSFVWAAVKRLYPVAGGILVGVAAAIAGGHFVVPEFYFLGYALAVGVLLFAGFKGNGWLAESAALAGYEFQTTVAAGSKADALSRFRRTTTAGERLRQRGTTALADLVPKRLQPLVAVVALTWKAAFRYRLFVAVTLLLVGSVVLLPMILKDDGTARGFTQILITYTLSVITGLLGFATLWLSCGVLARDIEECQVQMLVVKPIPRWQIWLGKWLGIVGLNAALLAISGGSVYGLLMYRASTLPAEQQEVLENEVFVARAGFKENVMPIEEVVERVIADRTTGVNTNDMDFYFVRREIEESVRATFQVVPPGNVRRWTIPMATAIPTLGREPIYLRVKFYGANTNAMTEHYGEWAIGSGDDVIRSEVAPLAANTFHEVQVPITRLGPDASAADLLNSNGELIVEFTNRDNQAVIFPLEDGMEVMYREGGFELNFIRGLLIILFWLSLFAALGLAASSYMSFPVACFFSLGLLIVVFSGGAIASSIQEGTVFGRDHETGAAAPTALDEVVMPVYKGMLSVISLVEGYSPVDKLSSGRSITWDNLAAAFFRIVVLLGGVFSLAGMALFSRRELAAAQSGG